MSETAATANILFVRVPAPDWTPAKESDFMAAMTSFGVERYVFVRDAAASHLDLYYVPTVCLHCGKVTDADALPDAEQITAALEAVRAAH